MTNNHALSKLLRNVPAEKARRRFRDFIPLAWAAAEPCRPFIRSWHIDLIADHLQAVANGQIRRLLINVPSGHAKSLLVSVLWPAWLWVIDPQRRGIFASYDSDLAIRDSMRCRSVLSSELTVLTHQPALDSPGSSSPSK